MFTICPICKKSIENEVVNNFCQHIEREGISKYRISLALKMSANHVGKVLRKERTLSDSLRSKLNEYLGTDF